ncbi:unnamed protein product [Eruca vesicaria subsp. sativa]|uniref:Uncharacterized protein n=1 Tax=Eruca vesicaria subsp. sativa TaxID=29727 RepID=A0ABC8L995_ERUVS|nr:unnamed protein product [Eruca vesicaria subsp. sativa]
MAHSEVVRGVNECIVRLEPDNMRRITALMQEETLQGDDRVEKEDYDEEEEENCYDDHGEDNHDVYDDDLSDDD